MKKTTLLKTALLLTATFRASTGMAGTWYGTLGVGDGLSNNSYFTTDYTHHFAYKLGFGYDFSKNFALEGDFQHFIRAKDPLKYEMRNIDNASDAYALHLLFVGKIPVSEKINVFGKVGPGYLRESNDWHWDGRYTLAAGAGAEMALTEKLGISAEYLATSIVNNNPTHGIYTNLTWRFK